MRKLKIHSGSGANFENDYDLEGRLIGYRTIVDGDIILEEKYPIDMSDSARSRLFWSNIDSQGEFFRAFIYEDEQGERNPMGATKKLDGHECMSDYDLSGNLVSYSDSLGNYLFQEFDALNRLIYIDDNEGEVIWYEYSSEDLNEPSNVSIRNTTNDILEYDKDGNCIYIKLATGYEIHKTYDDQGNILSYRNSDGIEFFNEYIDI
jgi:YD repeat-containing protein